MEKGDGNGERGEMTRFEPWTSGVSSAPGSVGEMVGVWATGPFGLNERARRWPDYRLLSMSA